MIEKSGAWFSYDSQRLGQGRENVKNFLAENLDLMVEISEKIKTEVGLAEVDLEAIEAEAEAEEDQDVDA